MEAETSLLKKWARACKCELRALLLASRHPQTPWYAKAWLAGVVGYALSPIDLIPDFIPVLGYLDDLILLPLGIWIGLYMVPAHVMAECRSEAERVVDEKQPGSYIAAAAIVLIWTVVGLAIAFFIYRHLR